MFCPFGSEKGDYDVGGFCPGGWRTAADIANCAVQLLRAGPNQIDGTSALVSETDRLVSLSDRPKV